MRVLQNMLDELQIECPKRDCTEVVAYNQYNDHLKSCKKKTACVGCNVAIKDTELENHQDLVSEMVLEMTLFLEGARLL